MQEMKWVSVLNEIFKTLEAVKVAKEYNPYSRDPEKERLKDPAMTQNEEKIVFPKQTLSADHKKLWFPDTVEFLLEFISINRRPFESSQKRFIDNLEKALTSEGKKSGRVFNDTVAIAKSGYPTDAPKYGMYGVEEFLKDAKKEKGSLKTFIENVGKTFEEGALRKIVPAGGYSTLINHLNAVSEGMSGFLSQIKRIGVKAVFLENLADVTESGVKHTKQYFSEDIKYLPAVMAVVYEAFRLLTKEWKRLDRRLEVGFVKGASGLESFIADMEDFAESSGISLDVTSYAAELGKLKLTNLEKSLLDFYEESKKKIDKTEEFVESEKGKESIMQIQEYHKHGPKDEEEGAEKTDKPKKTKEDKLKEYLDIVSELTLTEKKIEDLKETHALLRGLREAATPYLNFIKSKAVMEDVIKDIVKSNKIDKKALDALKVWFKSLDLLVHKSSKFFTLDFGIPQAKLDKLKGLIENPDEKAVAEVLAILKEIKPIKINFADSDLKDEFEEIKSVDDIKKLNHQLTLLSEQLSRLYDAVLKLRKKIMPILGIKPGESASEKEKEIIQKLRHWVDSIPKLKISMMICEYEGSLLGRLEKTAQICPSNLVKNELLSICKDLKNFY